MRRLQALDRRLGPPLCALVALPRRAARAVRGWRDAWDRRRGALRPPAPARRVLVIKFWGLGSLTLLTPALAALRQRHPGASVELLTLAAHAPLAAALPQVDAVHTFEVRGGGVPRLVGRLARLALRLRRARFDVVYDLEFLTSTSALVGALAGPRRLVGFTSARVARGGLHDETQPFVEAKHVAESFRDLAAGRALGPVGAADASPPRLDPAASARVAELVPTRPPQRLAVLNPNVGELAPERRWPAERFAGLARALAGEGFRVVLVGAANEREVTGAIAAAAPAALDLAGALSLAELCALLARADLVVSNDSGPMHIAAVLGAPTVGLFGPESPRRYAPLGPRVQTLWDPPPCGPCINVHDNKLAGCVLGRAECMLRLSLDEVLRAARSLAGPRRGAGAHAVVAEEHKTP